MSYVKLKRCVAVFATLMLTACGSYAKPETAPLMLLPAEYAAHCPPPVFPSDSSADQVMLTLSEMYSLYGTCAGRFVDLVDWITERGAKP